MDLLAPNQLLLECMLFKHYNQDSWYGYILHNMYTNIYFAFKIAHDANSNARCYHQRCLLKLCINYSTAPLSCYCLVPLVLSIVVRATLKVGINSGLLLFFEQIQQFAVAVNSFVCPQYNKNSAAVYIDTHCKKNCKQQLIVR